MHSCTSTSPSHPQHIKDQPTRPWLCASLLQTQQVNSRCIAVQPPGSKLQLREGTGEGLPGFCAAAASTPTLDGLSSWRIRRWPVVDLDGRTSYTLGATGGRLASFQLGTSSAWGIMVVAIGHQC